MVFPITGGTQSTGYEVSNSLRFNDGDNAELTRTPGSEGNKQIHTISMWVKRCTIDSNQALFSAGPNDSTVYSIRFLSDSLYISQSSGFVKDTSRLFRDPSAWYHIVIAIDTTDGTQNDRIKVYINGVLETSFAENTFAGGQSFNTNVNDDVIHAIGYDTLNDSVPFDGHIAEFHLIDGTQKAASDFGEFDDNGVWIPKAYTGTYGTNGVYLKFKQTGTGTNASGMGADTSGNTHHYAPVNLAATDVTTDTPTNNFATINPLLTNDGSTHSEGNTKLTTPTGPGISGPTIAMTKGKWYAEFICTAKGTVNMNVGIVKAESFDGNNQMDEGDNVGYMYQNNGNIFHGGADESYGASWAVDDIIGIAFNADDSQITFLKNGSALVSNYTISTTRGTIFPFIKTGINTVSEVNWGGCSAFTVSSAASDANGYGNFEHAPPSGYLALCSKNLGSDGG